VVRLSKFWELMNDEFGQGYAASLAQDHVLGALGGLTAMQALDAGESPRTVWHAICDDMDVPVERRLGAGRKAPK
jgi:hypothetical protein